MNRIAMTMTILAALATSGCNSEPSEPVLTASARDLKGTTITPHLEAPLTGDENVLWCATFQIVWNALCIEAGGDVHLVDGEPPMVGVLNKRAVTKAVLDDPSYVAIAGMIGDGVLQKIRDELQRKFAGRPSTPLLDSADTLPPDHWVAYAYLLKDLPFEHVFLKYDHALDFAGRKVKSFGVFDHHYPYEKLREIAQQAKVVDVATLPGAEGDEYPRGDPDNFIIELVTKPADDRLILAKVPPEKTLAETVAAVRGRVAKAKPKPLSTEDTLRIPSLDFDLTRHFDELEGKLIRAPKSDFNGQPLVMAAQRVCFRLNEAGARLESEGAIAAMSEPMTLGEYIFDKPFLILLERKGAANPYFALWVGNAELLVPFKR